MYTQNRKKMFKAIFLFCMFYSNHILRSRFRLMICIYFSAFSYIAEKYWNRTKKMGKPENTAYSLCIPESVPCVYNIHMQIGRVTALTLPMHIGIARPLEFLRTSYVSSPPLKTPILQPFSRNPIRSSVCV